MFGSIGGAELLLILVVALLLFGPRKLPQIGRTIGKGLSEFRKATTDFRMNLEREVDLEGVRSAGREIERTAEQVRVARGDVTARGGAPVPPDVAQSPVAPDPDAPKTPHDDEPPHP